MAASAEVAKGEPNRRSRLRRRLSGVLLIGLMALVIGYGVQRLGDPRVLPLKLVRIDGVLRHLERSDLEAAVAGAVRGNFFTVDVARVQRAAQRLAWVDQVSVRRIWPDTLLMRVRERKPLARWGRRRLVDGSGVIFAPRVEEIPQGLPLFIGPDDRAAAVVADYNDIRRQVRTLGLQPVELRWDERGARRVRFAPDLTLYLGGRDNPIGLETFVDLYPELMGEKGRRPVRVDLRYTNGLAVGWKKTPVPEKGQGAPGASGSAGKQKGRGRV